MTNGLGLVGIEELGDKIGHRKVIGNVGREDNKGEF